MREVVLLDGGLGQELVRRSRQPAHPLWSLQVMLNEPALVEQVHVEFLHAGARVLTLNTYAATPERLGRQSMEDQFVAIQQRAIEIALRARERAAQPEKIRISGCLPPLVASYHPELTPSFAQCLEEYRRIVAVEWEAVDLFLCETMACQVEAQAAAQAASESGKPAWVALTVEDEYPTETPRLRSGELLEEVVDSLGAFAVDAILLNCSKPEALSPALSILAKQPRPFGAYANGFTSVRGLQVDGTVDALQARQDLGPEAYAHIARAWVERGARLVGGCCEVGPSHIAELHRQLLEQNVQIASDLTQRPLPASSAA
jgi:S-methylmethionine-dependent homocysteine/selenocysteine methylase